MLQSILPSFQTAELGLPPLGIALENKAAACSPILPTIYDVTDTFVLPHPSVLFSYRVRNPHVCNPLAIKSFKPAIVFASLL